MSTLPTPDRIRLRVTGQYLAVFLLALLLGVLLCALIGPEALPSLAPAAAAHFASPFAECSTATEAAVALLDGAAVDIRTLLIVFTCGFTLFCPPALCLVTAWRGLSLGFAAVWLGNAVAAGEITLAHGNAAFLLFLAQGGLIAAALVELAAETVIFSFAYRRVCGRPRRILRAPFVWRYLGRALTMFGFVVIVHGLAGGLCGLLGG